MNKTITLNKYDFKAGVNKFFTDADLSFSDFKEERQKDIAEADVVLFQGLGVDDVPLGGRVLKDVHGTSFYAVAKREMSEAYEEEAKQSRYRNALWLIAIAIYLLVYFNR
jgi:hypothetical protein